LSEAVRIKRLIPSSKLVCSGFSKSGRTTHAEILAQAAIELGINETDTLMLVTPANTEEEAISYYSRFKNYRQLILVTDATHMPRAIKRFQSHGLQPIAAPANHYIKIDPQTNRYHFKPSISKIQMMQSAIYEYAGLLEFSLGG
jgi:uncharacterized SAM-binding protein YcdF (DUF218 family)